MRITRAVCDLINVASKESTRYGINGVLLYRVDGETVRAEATDGRRAVRLKWADRGKGKFRRILPRKACVELRKLLKSRRVRPGIAAFVFLNESAPTGKIIAEIHSGGSRGGSGQDMERFTYDAVPDKFPNLDKVIPKYGRTKAVQVGVNPELWNGVMAAMSGKEATTVTVKLPLDDPRKSPVLFRSTIDDGDVPIRATGVLMQRSV